MSSPSLDFPPGDEPLFSIGGRRIGRKGPVLIVAEAGTSHGGELSHARELIDAAAESGADCVKFQWVIADEIVHPLAGSIRLPGGPTPIWERFRRLERPASFYAKLKEYTEERGLLFLCSPFGPHSARLLLQLGVEAVKIASPELNHYPLLYEVTGYPLLLSTGVSSLGDIEMCLDYLRSADPVRPDESIGVPSATFRGRGAPGLQAALLHCITAYPAPEEEYNLRVVPLLSRVFGTVCGVSDHSSDPLIVPLLSVSQGARIIEKHVCLDRKTSGLDDPIALEPKGFASMCAHIRDAESLPARRIVDDCRRLFSAPRVDAVLGHGRKVLAPSEKNFYRTTNRSLVALHDLAPGDVLSDRNTALLRCEQNRRPGLAPRYRDIVMGAAVRRPVAAGDGICWDTIL